MGKKSARYAIAWMAVVSGVLGAGQVGAQGVRWESGQSLAVGQRATLELRFDGAGPQGTVTLPEIEGLEVLGRAGQASRTHTTQSGWGAAKTETTVTLAYPVRPTREGRIEIPSFEVMTQQGRVRVPATGIDVGRTRLAGAGGGEIGLDEVVSAQLLPADRRPFAGEVFDLDFVVTVGAGRRGELLGDPVSRDPHLLAGDWGEGRSVRFDGRPGVQFRTPAMVAESGSVHLSPVEQEVAIETGRSRSDPFDRFDSFFGGQSSSFSSLFDRTEKARVIVSSEPVEVEVQPLPGPVPQEFSGAVGQFQLKSQVVPQKPRAGEPVTWTLSLEGRGNWASGVSLPGRSIGPELRTLEPHLERDFSEGDRFTGRIVEDLVLIPETEGVHVLDPVRFVYFDPMTESYRESVVQPEALEVVAGWAPSTPAPSPQGGPAPQAVAASELAGEASMDEFIAPLPADVREGGGHARPPMSGITVGVAAATPLAGLFAYVLLLGLRRARHTDPNRPRREAFDAMQSAVEALRGSEGARAPVRDLRAWQVASARFLELDRAAPSIAEFRELDTSESGEWEASLVADWIGLWRESDRALYADAARLPRDWCTRASRLMENVQRPRFNPARSLLPRNWAALGSAAAVVGLMFSVAQPVRAEGTDAYRAGEFEAARTVWLEQVAADPMNWVARYNLGLAEAQRQDEARAFAHTAAAFVAAPRDGGVQRNLSLFGDALAEEGRVDPVLSRLAFGTGPAFLARQASPWEWQWVAIAGAIGVALGGALLLRRRHAGSTGTPWGAWSWVAAGFAGIGLSLVSLHQYGDLVHPHGALVVEASTLRSVPTDAQASQVQRPLPTGTYVRQGREFLGWLQVELPGGEVGWLRAGDLVPLYGVPEA